MGIVENGIRTNATPGTIHEVQAKKMIMRSAVDGQTWEVNGYTYNADEMMQLIVSTMVDTGKGLEAVCKRKGFPPYATCLKWLRQFPAFAEAYKEAKLIRGEQMAEKAIEAAEGVELKDDVPAAKLKVETYKWFAGKANPEFGDKKTIDVSHTINGAPEEILDARIMELLKSHPELGTLAQSVVTDAVVLTPESPQEGAN